jgi:hypothetical protein
VIGWLFVLAAPKACWLTMLGPSRSCFLLTNAGRGRRQGAPTLNKLEKKEANVLSDDELAILKAIRPGRDALGTGTSEEELQVQFPDRLDIVRQLAAAGYLEVVTIALEETGSPSPDVRVYHLTDRGEAALGS